MIYFDNNASTPISPKVRASISVAAEEHCGNPSSSHRFGRSLRKLVEIHRNSLAELVGVNPGGVYFTSGATEANNQVLMSVAGGQQNSCIVTTPVEHPSVLAPIAYLEDRGMRAVFVDVDSDGIVDLDSLRAALRHRPDLVSIQWVNNETGVIQPITEVSRLCREFEVQLHVDAAQAVGKIENLCRSDVQPDYLTVSGHKFHAPPGIGALIVADSASVPTLVRGGGQEQGKRSGTENWLGIVGIGTAASEVDESLMYRLQLMGGLRDRFETLLLDRLEYAVVIGRNTDRVPNTSNVMFRGLDGQALVAQFNGQGICCSQNSACSNQRPEPSHVLRAMGLSEQDAYSCVRFSFSVMNTFEEVDLAIEIIESCTARLAAFMEGV
jgi:cysteine desulfurase